jgi:hypothetical protein
MARIFFYRTENPFLIALEPEIVVNGKAVGRAIHGDAFYRDAKPGRYEIFLAGDHFNIVGSHLTAVRVLESTGRPEFLERMAKRP